MGYDPSQGTFKPLTPEQLATFTKDIPRGVVFTEGETVDVKGAKFSVHEVGESRLVQPIKS